MYRPSIFIVLALFSLNLSLHAQKQGRDSSSIRNINLNEVIIKSFKQRHDLRLEPVSASIMTGSAIENRNISGIKEISAMIPNLFMPDYGSKLTSPVYIRGIGSRINSPSVGLYVDGIPYFDKSAFDFDFAEIDRVEILRGPQGTLYGRNTMGGLINVYTRSPLRYQGTTLRITNGNYGYLQYGLSRYKTINEKFGYGITANYTHNNGYFTNQYTENKADKLNSASTGIRLQWKPVSSLLIALNTNFDYLNQGGYPYAELDSVTSKPGKINYNDYSYYKRNMSTSGLSVTYLGKGYSISSQSAFQYIDDNQGVDQDFTESSVYFAKQKQKQKMFSEEINIKSTLSTNYKWLFGAFAFWQKTDRTVGIDYKKAGYQTTKQYNDPVFAFALYHQSSIDDLFIKGLSLTLGLRYDYERASTDYLYYKDKDNNTTLEEKSKAKLNFSQLLPKIALQYLFPSSGQIYATVTKGYKTGGFNTSFESEKDHAFRPENSWNYELGVKHPFLDNRIRGEICLFWIDWKNQQITQTLPSNIGNRLTNAGRSSSKGLEVSLQMNPLNRLMIQLNYGYTHAVFKDYTDLKKGQTIVYTGNYLPMVPKHTFGIGADYSVSNPCSFIDRFIFSANYTGAGRIYWREDNQTSQPFYGTLGTKISANKDFLTASVWAKNITNTKYTTYYFETGGRRLGQAGRPFTFGATIQLNF